MNDLLADTGRLGLSAWRDARGAFNLFGWSFARLVRNPLAGGRAVKDELVRQLYFTGVEGLLATTILAFLVGAITTGQLLTILSGPQARDLLGTAMRVVVVRELAPVLAAVIVVARSASAIAVDLGNLVIRGELEALEAMGIDPIRYVVMPRVIGVAVSTACLCVVFDLYAMVGGMAAARELVGFPVVESLHAVGEAVEPFDLVLGVSKAAVFGVVIAVVSTQEGLGIARSAMEVPRATRRAVVGTLMMCVVLDALITLWLLEAGL